MWALAWFCNEGSGHCHAYCWQTIWVLCCSGDRIESWSPRWEVYSGSSIEFSIWNWLYGVDYMVYCTVKSRHPCSRECVPNTHSLMSSRKFFCFLLFWGCTWRCSGLSPDFVLRNHFWQALGDLVRCRDWAWIGQMQCKHLTCFTVSLAFCSTVIPFLSLIPQRPYPFAYKVLLPVFFS